MKPRTKTMLTLSDPELTAAATYTALSNLGLTDLLRSTPSTIAELQTLASNTLDSAADTNAIYTSFQAEIKAWKADFQKPSAWLLNHWSTTLEKFGIESLSPEKMQYAKASLALKNLDFSETEREAILEHSELVSAVNNNTLTTREVLEEFAKTTPVAVVAKCRKL